MSEPVILWFRRDLRLHDNPALAAAVATGRPILPLYVLDETEGVRAPGAAGLWWLDKSLAALGADLAERGAPLILRRGAAEDAVKAVVKESGARAVFWNRLYDPATVARDARLKTELTEAGVTAKSCNGALLIEPWEVKTGTGGPYKVFTAFWRAARPQIEPPPSAASPKALHAAGKVRSDRLADWALHPTTPGWSTGFDWRPGEAGAQAALDRFIDAALNAYPTGRDRPDRDETSRLSPYLHWGEIGPRQVWRAIQRAVHHGDAREGPAEKFLAELGWREFNHQLLFNQPDLAAKSVRPQFDQLKWRRAPSELKAWQAGMTGYPIVDAGMRQLWATGWMHNRVRMIVGSFLVKDLLIDWREGERWFWDTLVDADEANNAANWQWVAGSGADASPFFRIFNPITQGERFDPDGTYVKRWVPELAGLGAKHVHAPWTAPRGAAPNYPRPMVDHAQARERALDALKAIRSVAPAADAS